MTLKDRIEARLLKYPAIYRRARSYYHKAKPIADHIAVAYTLRKNTQKRGFFIKERIAFVDSKDVEWFSYSKPEGVAVIMPCIDAVKGFDTAQFLIHRAGMECAVILAYDSKRLGFIKILNEIAAKTDVAYVVYLAQDAYPGRDWLKIAYENLKSSGKGLLAFNDGKWHGQIASFGLVKKAWIQRLYGDNILFPQYKSHAADMELTVIARVNGMFVYEPRSVLVEVDRGKDFRDGSNPYDNQLFKNRFLNGFYGLVSYEGVEALTEEYSRLIKLDP